jgi:hypothetical protein
MLEMSLELWQQPLLLLLRYSSFSNVHKSSWCTTGRMCSLYLCSLLIIELPCPFCSPWVDSMLCLDWQEQRLHLLMSWVGELAGRELVSCWMDSLAPSLVQLLLRKCLYLLLRAGKKKNCFLACHYEYWICLEFDSLYLLILQGKCRADWINTSWKSEGNPDFCCFHDLLLYFWWVPLASTVGNTDFFSRRKYWYII